MSVAKLSAVCRHCCSCFLKCFEIFQCFLLLQILDKSICPKSFKFIRILKNKVWFSLHRPISFISILHCRWLSWNPLLSKLTNYLLERLNTLCRFTVQTIISIDYYLLKLFENITWVCFQPYCILYIWVAVLNLSLLEMLNIWTILYCSIEWLNCPVLQYWILQPFNIDK